MRTNWPLIAGIVAVLSVPFALAVLEDTAGEKPDVDPAPAPDAVEWGEDRLPPPPAPPQSEPAARWQDVRAMSAGFFEDVFFQGQGAGAPSLAGPLAGADFGMSREELARAAPRLVAWAEGGASPYAYLRAALFYETPGVGLSRVRFSFPDDGTARRVFASRWGAPLEQSRAPHGARLWLNPDLGVRLVLREQPGRAVAELQPYWPLEALIAPGGDRATFGFGRSPLLGASREKVRRAYADELLSSDTEEEELALRLPASTYARAPTEVTLELEEDRVRELRFELDCSYAGSCEEAVASLFEREHGSYQREGTRQLELAFPEHEVTLDMRDTFGAAMVRVTRR